MKSLDRRCFVLLSFTLPSLIYAQITINGTVTDHEQNPIHDALVEIIDEADTTNKYSDFTDEFGNYTIANITDILNINTVLPKDYIVLSNYPNPFNPSTIIYFEIPKAEKIEIKIYDILGREVRTLFNNFYKAGIYQIIWDGRNNFGVGVSAGIYLCRLKTKDNFKVHKMVLLDGGSNTVSVSNNKVRKAGLHSISKINGLFNFTIRVSGSSILESDFPYLTCSSDTTVNLIVPIILQTATIGPEGGKLENEDFSLIIPPGAFDEVAKIDFSIDPNDSSFIQNSASPMFLFDGIPDNFSKDLLFGIKLDNQTSDTLFSAIWKSNGEEYYFNIKTTFDSLGYQYCKITSYYNSIINTRRLNKNFPIIGFRIAMKFIKDYSSLDAGLFYYHYPKKFSNEFSLFNLLIWEVPQIFKYMGFTSDKFPTWELRPVMEVLVNKRYKSSYIAQQNPFERLRYTRMTANNLIEINDTYFNASYLPEIRREFAHLYYYSYFFYKIFDDNKTYLKNNREKWLNQDPYLRVIHNAIATWCEENFQPISNSFIPNSFKGNELQIFNGLVAGVDFNSIISYEYKHSYGLAVLIKYLMNEYGTNLLFKYYNKIAVKKSAIESFLESISESPNLETNQKVGENIWLPEFYKQYVSSNIYNVPGEKFLNNISETINFNVGDTLKYADKTYTDLSAKLFRININSDEIKNNLSLRFKLGPESLNLDYVKTLVFGIKDDNLIYLQGGDDFLVGNLSAYNGLLACVVNSGNEQPYTGTSDIKLDIKVSKDPPFNHCDIKIRVITPQDTSHKYWEPWWWTDGYFKDNIYTGTINSKLQGGNATGSIQITVDDYHNIIFLSVMASSTNEGFSSEWGFTAANVFPTSESPYGIDYKYYGNDVCIYVPSIYAKYTESDGSVLELNQRDCDENSILEIKFHNWR